jgi:predicted nucleotidyltransferase
VLEQRYSPLIVHTTPEHAELKAICNPRQGVITKHHSHHYFGFAGDAVEALRQGTATAREAVARRVSRAAHGHSPDRHRVNANLVELNEEVRLPYIARIIARKYPM